MNPVETYTLHASVHCLLLCISPDAAPDLQYACPSSEPDALTSGLSSAGSARTHKETHTQGCGKKLDEVHFVN